MPSVILIPGVLLLLLVVHDASLCVSFYLETNRGASRSRGQGQRPRRLAPDQVTLRHALLFLIQKANYHWQLLTAIPLLGWLYLRPRRSADRDVALLIVNTSLMTWVSTRRLAGGGVAATLAMDEFAFPLLRDRFDCRLLVEWEMRPAGAVTPTKGPEAVAMEARTLRFELDGVTIESVGEQLSILAMMISSVAHPVIHSFNNRLYASHDDPRLRGFDDLFLHGQYLNAIAWFFPGLLFRIGQRGHHWYRQVLAHNAELRLPVHDHATMAALLPYSRSMRFLLGARGALSALRRRYDLPVDGESLFVCTILHAVDHASCDLHTRGHLLRNERLPNEGLFNLVALLYYRPAQHFFTNRLRDKRRKNPLYEELYAKLRQIDPDLADQVTLSISY